MGKFLWVAAILSAVSLFIPGRRVAIHTSTALIQAFPTDTEERVQIVVRHLLRTPGMPLAEEIVHDAQSSLARLGGAPDGELNSAGFARVKVLEARARINVLLGQVAAPELVRPIHELRRELHDALLPTWKDCLCACGLDGSLC